jgi:CubicO group peptidase (beta-lactamase class C family)
VAQPLSVSGSKARWFNTSGLQDAEKLKATLAALSNANQEILGMAASASGAWVVTTANGYFTGGELPSGMGFWLSLLQSQGETLRAVAINAAGGYVIVGDSTYRVGGAVAQGVQDKLSEYFDNGWGVRDVELTDVGYVILGSGNLASYSGVPESLSLVLADRLKSRRTVQQVALGFDGRWAVVSGQEPATRGASSQLVNLLRASARNQVHVSKLMLGPSDSFVLYSHGQAAASPGNVAEAIEYGSPGGQNLWERMAAIGVPGVSVAIIANNQVAFARGYGVLKQGEDDPVLATTPFDMASLSKFLGALTLVRLDADPNYDFDLDDSVVDRAKPGGIVEQWLAEGEANPGAYGFANVDVSNQLAVAHFLRHQSDFVPSGGSPGFGLNTPGLLAATTLDLLLGYDCTSGCGFNGVNFAWTSNGTGPVQSAYDSVNFLVPQAVAEDVTGKPAWRLMSDYFITPMGLRNISGYVASRLSSRAAWQHNASGPQANRTVYPWTFAGGVYAAPMDYAEMMILALNQGRDSSGVERVPAAAISRMLQVQNGNVGFGLFAETNANITEGNDNSFRHSGSHGGRARTYMCGNPTRDGGIVIAFNADVADGSDADNTNETVELRNYILAQYMASVGWPGDCR